MTRFSDIIRKHGSRNTGDNLLGFQLDMDAYLQSSDLFECVDVKPTGNDDCIGTDACGFLAYRSRCWLQKACRMRSAS